MLWKIPWYSIGRFALIVLCLTIVLALVVTVLPIYLEVTAFRGPVEEILTSLIDAPVTVGEVRLHPSLWPTLQVSDVEVAGSGQRESPLSGRIGEIELKLSLLPLLRENVRIKRLFASGAHLRWHHTADRPSNRPVSTASTFELVELSNIDLQNITIDFEDQQTARIQLIIDTLTSDISAKRPLALQLDGTLQGLPLSVSMGGPTLASLSQAVDFPLLLELQLADLELGLEGSISRAPTTTNYQFSFDLASTDLAVIRSLWLPDLPKIGGVELTGHVASRSTKVQFSDLEGSLGSTSLHGRLSVDHKAEERPRVTGRVSLGKLDLEPWIEYSKTKESDPSEPLPFASLSAFDIDLKLTLQSLVGLAKEVDDLSMQIGLENAHLEVPTTLTVAGVALSANLEIQGDVEKPEIAARVWTQDLTLAQLDEIVDVPDSLAGQIGALDLQITTSGSSSDALGANLLMVAAASQTTLDLMGETEEQSVEIYFKQAQITHRPGQPLTATANGQLYEEAFAAQLQTGSLATLQHDDSWPLSLALQGAGANIELEGVLEPADTGVDLDMSFEVSGDHLHPLEKWLGLQAGADLPYELTGQLSSEAGARLLRIEPSSIGRTQFSGQLAWDTSDEAVPVTVDLHATALDLKELHGPSSSVVKLDATQKTIAIDIPIVPSKVTFHDGEIEVVVDRLYRDTVDLTNLKGSFHFQEGRLKKSPFSFTYDSQQATGEIDLDLRGEVPRFALTLHGRGTELGEFLEHEGIITDFQVVASQLDLRLEGSGTTAREIIRSADLTGQLLDVRWVSHPEGFEKPLNVRLERVDVSGPKGKPIVMTASGDLNEAPLDLRLELRVAGDPLKDIGNTLPFVLSLGLAATDLELEGEVELPIARAEFDSKILIKGETLATLSVLVGEEVPDLGPYRLQGLLDLGKGGVSLKDMDLVLGETDLHGEVSYFRIDQRPNIRADLTSRLIRSEDFFQSGPPPEETEHEETEETAIEKAPRVFRSILDRLGGFDASVDLKAQEVLSADRSARDLVIDLKLDRGNLDLFLKRRQDGDRDAELKALVRPWNDGVKLDVQAYWDRQPYGLIGNLVSPGSADGSWGVDLDLSTRGANLQELAANLSGRFYFANYPEDFNSTIFDLWGGGLISSILPVFQIGSESRLNCSIAKFTVDHGVLTPEPLIIDSTRTRISGKGTIDLPGNKIQLKLRPRPKQRNLINLSTPMNIRGSLTHPDVQVSKGGMALTFFRLSLWVYTVWRDIARKPLPADGRDVCVDPFAPVLE